MDRLSGEIAVVTGSTAGGIGTAIARRFAEEGASVVVTGRRDDRGEAIAGSIRQAGGTAIFVRADLTERDDCAALFAETTRQLGPVTVLVNNAASDLITTDAVATDVKDETWADMFAVNVSGPLWMIQAALPSMMEAGHGSIVNVSSRASLRAGPRATAYSSSKGALNALTRSVAVDYAQHGVRCNTIAPGFVVGKEKVPELDARVTETFAKQHLTRLPTVDDVAWAAVYLASHESDAVTGVILPVDGGGTSARAETIG